MATFKTHSWDSLSEDNIEHDKRVSIDLPVPSEGRFVRRVEEAVTLQLDGDTMKNYPPLTIPSFFANACQRFKDRVALISLDSRVRTTTFEQYYSKAMGVAKGLIAAGLKHLEGVAFMCHNTSHMFYAIMGTILAGGVFVDLYASDNKTWIIHTMSEARVSFVFVDSVYAKDIQLDAWDELVTMRSIVFMMPWLGNDPRVITLEQLVGYGHKLNHRHLVKRLGMHAPNRCCAIFYRSNETLNQPSTPGVMMSHDNLTLMATLIGEKILNGELGNFPDVLTRSLKLISTLPITKPAAFVLEVLLPLAIGGCIHTSNDKLSMTSLWRLVTAVEPNIFCAATRVWINLRNKLTGRTRGPTTLREWLLKQAKRSMLRSHMEGSKVSKLGRIIITRVIEKLGLRQVGLCLCFGSALPQTHFEFFLSLNIQIVTIREVRYLSGPHSITLNTNERRLADAMGTVFDEFKTVTVRLGKTGASRMLVDGRHVCMGILQDSMPVHVSSMNSLDTEALTVNIQGELFFVGSTGDEIVLKTGAVLSSKCVESSFKRLVPIVGSCMLVGDGMKTAALLITIKTTINPETLQATNLLPLEVQEWCQEKLENRYTSAEQLTCCKKLHVIINGAITLINRLIKRSGAWIEAYRILPKNFSIVDMEMDPITQELNRDIILDRYRDELNTLYPNY